MATRDFLRTTALVLLAHDIGTAKEDTSEDDTTSQGEAGSNAFRAESSPSSDSGITDSLGLGFFSAQNVEAKKQTAAMRYSAKPVNKPSAPKPTSTVDTISKTLLRLSAPRCVNTKKILVKNQTQFCDSASLFAEWTLGFKAWRKKHGVDDATKVFQIVGKYEDARAALLRRGWVENADTNSPFFNLRWTTRAQDARNVRVIDRGGLALKIKWKSASHGKNAGKTSNTSATTASGATDAADAAGATNATNAAGATGATGALSPTNAHNNDTRDDDSRHSTTKNLPLFPGQVVNHIAGASRSLTTKAGLHCSLRSHAAWFSIDRDSFFPLCYDLSLVGDETCVFHGDFESTLARGVLRRVLTDGDLRPDGVPDEFMVRVALRVCKHQAAYEASLSNDEALVVRDDVPFVTPLETHERDALLSVAKRTGDAGNSNGITSSSHGDANRPVPESNQVVFLSAELKQECETVLRALDDGNVQVEMEGSRNVWILKPAGKSRGRGIGCVQTLEHVKQHVANGSNGLFEKQKQAWVAQKYVENPLLISGRKFDVRVWVVVASVAPLRVWVWREPYLRFCAERFGLDDVGNVFKHLSNNAVSTCSEAHVTDAFGDGNMWRLGEFKAWLKKEKLEEGIKNKKHDGEVTRAEGDEGVPEGGGGVYIPVKPDADNTNPVAFGTNVPSFDPYDPSQITDRDTEIDIWDSKIAPQIDYAVTSTLRCAEADGLEVTPKEHGRSFALFGYDFVLDDKMHVWLLEVNSSPCMEHSTTVTSALCPRAFHDLFTVLADDNNLDDCPGTKRGGWELTHVGEESTCAAAASATMAKWGVDLVVRGESWDCARPLTRRRRGDANANGGTNQTDDAVLKSGFHGLRCTKLAGKTGGLPRAPAFETAWQRLAKTHTQSSQAARVARAK